MNLKTVLHQYTFDTSKPDELAAWQTLKASLEAQGLKVFETHGGGSHYMGKLAPSRAVELETACLFDNQWNTAPIEGFSDSGYRVMDWALDSRYAFANQSSRVKRGHYLEQTPAMAEIRRATHVCGYCGKYEPAQKFDFCPHCLDSAYLTEKELHLTRMRPVCDSRRDFAPLSDAERAHLVPLFNAAQLHGTTERGKARIAKARADIESKLKRDIATANEEYTGALWVLNNVPGLLENHIYYSHTNRHCFGWRKPLSADVLSALLDKVSEFPGNYDIKCADGRTLSN